MSEWQKILEQCDAHDGPGPDFEERVFSKIKKRKKQKKISFAVMAVIGLVMLLSFLPLFRSTPRHALISGIQTQKEEIPLSEDLFFSASDSRTRYSLEPVSFQKRPSNQDIVINQI